MKPTTLFLKVVVVLLALPVLAVCVVVLPSIARNVTDLQLARWLYPILMGMFASSVPFFFALYQALRILNNIDANKAFSELSVTALRNIKYSAMAIGAIYVMLMPPIFIVAEMDDAPGLAALGLVITFGSIVIAVFAAVLQELLKNAIEIKSENDLTV